MGGTMSAHITVKFLVAGLAALSPVEDGRIAILLPEVDPTEWARQGVYLPRHEAWFGYWRHDLEPGPDACGANRDFTPAPKEGVLCWVALDHQSVDLLTKRAGPPQDEIKSRRHFMGWKARMPGEGKPSEMSDFSWLADLSKIAPGMSLDPFWLENFCRVSGTDCRVNARSILDYSRRSSCRLAGKVDRWRREYAVSEVSFDTPSSTGAARQAVASATMFEIEVDAPQIQFRISKSDGTGESLVLPPRPCNEPCTVEVALVDSVPDREAAKAYLQSLLGMRDSRADDHFMVYYGLTARYWNQVVEPGKVPIPVEVPTKKAYYTDGEMEDQCKSPFLFNVRDASDVLKDKKGWRTGSWWLRSTILNYLLPRDEDSRSWVLVPNVVPPRAPGVSALSMLLGPPLCSQVKLTSP